MATVSGRFYSRIFAVATVLILGWLLYKILAPFMGSIAWALLFAFLAHPGHAWLTTKLKGRASVAAFIMTVAVVLLCIGPLAALSVAFVSQAGNLLQMIQDHTGGMDISQLSKPENVPFLQRSFDWVESVAGIGSQQLQAWVISGVQSMLKSFASAGGTLFMGALGTVIGFGVMIFLLFFFLRDGEQMLNRLVRLIPMAGRDKHDMQDYLAAVTRAVVFGTLLTAIIQGGLVGVSFAIVSLPSPVVFGVIAAILSLLPVGGTAFVWAPAAVVLAVQGRWGAAIFMVVWGAALVGLVDNFVRPLLISGRAEVPTLAVFIGVLGGLAAFGAVGLFVGPILLALALALLRYAEVQGGASRGA